MDRFYSENIAGVLHVTLKKVASVIFSQWPWVPLPRRTIWVQESDGLGDETVTEPDCSGSEAAEPPPREEQGEQTMVGVCRVHLLLSELGKFSWLMCCFSRQINQQSKRLTTDTRNWFTFAVKLKILAFSIFLNRGQLFKLFCSLLMGYYSAHVTSPTCCGATDSDTDVVH